MSDEGSVYFIAAGNLYVKIGWTRRGFVSQRIKELQTSSPHELRLLAAIPGSKGDEKRAHVKFAANHRLLEWFNLTPDLLRFVEESRNAGKVL